MLCAVAESEQVVGEARRGQPHSRSTVGSAETPAPHRVRSLILLLLWLLLRLPRREKEAVRTSCDGEELRGRGER